MVVGEFEGILNKNLKVFCRILVVREFKGILWVFCKILFVIFDIEMILDL